MKKLLTIAGSDCSGGAGIQADLKTFLAHKVYGMSVITALTAQNTMGVTDIFDVTPEFVGNQIDAIFKDIRPDAIKIGMVSNSKIIEKIIEKIEEYNPENIVIDPVIVSTSGYRLLSEEALNLLENKLIQKGTIITPNIPEAEVLCGFEIKTEEDMIRAAKKISEKGVTGGILIKGGHLVNSANDLLYTKGVIEWFKGERVKTENTHGTGCTLSAAIAVNLAKNKNLSESIKEAKKYVTGALKENFNLGNGNGPLNHGYLIKD